MCHGQKGKSVAPQSESFCNHLWVLPYQAVTRWSVIAQKEGIHEKVMDGEVYGNDGFLIDAEGAANNETIHERVG